MDLQDAIDKARISYEIAMGDGWRCDFCEPNCCCDQITLEGYALDICLEFPEANFQTVVRAISDY